MQAKELLPSKAAFRILALFLLLFVAGMTKAFAEYDFYATCPSGQRLYYTITSSTYHYVKLTYPGTGIEFNYWSDYTKPTGNIILPSTVMHNGISYTVTEIGDHAFYGCSGFTGSLTLPNSVTAIEYGAFYGCSGFTGSLTLPNSVTAIGDWAFDGCSGFTGSLTLPNSVTAIGDWAFYGCSGFTGSLTLPNSVTAIGDDAFRGCSGFTGSLTLPNSVTAIGNGTFFDCSGFTGSLTLPNSVTTIGNYAFYVCSGFTGSLPLPNSVTTIGYGAFRGCSGFTGSLTLPNSVTTIEYGAFYGCSGFTGSLTLPNSVTAIGDEAFYGCSGFTGINAFPETPPILGSSVFENVNHAIPVLVPCGAGEAYANAEQWGSFTNIFELCSTTYLTVEAAYSPDPSDPASPHVEVRWGVEGFESGVFSQPNWFYDATYPWAIAETNAYEGSYCMKSGNTGQNNTTSTISMVVQAPIAGQMHFFSRISSENSYDFGRFYIDGVEQDNWTGNHDWQESAFDLAAGTHILRWAYEKDYSQSSGEDCFYVDRLSFTESTTAPTSDYTFDDNTLQGWTTLDADGDGQVWYCDNTFNHTAGGTVSATSASWDNINQALTPDNYLVSPQVTLGGSISFWANARNDMYLGDHIGVAVSTLGNTDPSDFTTLAEWDVTSGWTQYTVDLSAYSGPGYVAIRHFDCTDVFRVNVDDIQITEGLVATSVYRAHCDGSAAQLLKAYAQGGQYLDTSWEELESGEYKYGVCASGTSASTALWSGCITKSAILHDVTVTVSPIEGGSISGAGTIVHGEVCTLTAMASEGYHFVSWRELDGAFVSDENPYSFTVTEDVALVANFGVNSYDITATVVPAEGGTVTGTGTYNHGETATLTATPAEGYTFVDWWRDGTYYSEDPILTITVTEASAFVANFSFNSYDVTVTANPTAGGTVTGAGTYGHGETATLTATPATGYTFVDWWRDGAYYSEDPSLSIIVTEASAFVANFSLNSYAIAATASPTAGGTVTGAGTYDHGQTCTLTATPVTGYTFVNWTEGGSQVSANPTYTFTVTGERTLVANFTMNSYVVSANAVPESGGTITGSGGYDYGQTCTLTATANAGYTFVNWTQGGSVVSTDLTYTFTVTTNATYTANFTLNSYAIAATASPTAGGTVTGAGTYDHGQTCTLTATPVTGYTFVNWTEGGSQVSANPTYTFTVTGERTLVANFVYVETCVVTTTANAVSGGTMTGAGTYALGATCTLTATAGEGYTFLYWSSGGVLLSTDPVYSFTVTGDITCTARFFLGEPPVQVSPASSGWTWWSTYIEQEGIDGLGQLKGVLGSNGIQIKTQLGYTNYYEGLGWVGMLTSINNESTYKIKTAAPCVLEIAGTETTSAAHPVTVGPGWNWIGYPVNASMSVTTAMSGITPANGDQLKALYGYANYYDGMGWMGTLSTITPGMGLLYKSNSSVSFTLTYPTGSKGEILAENITAENNHWVPDMHAYSDNMTVTAVVELDDEELNSENYELAAFANGECRGSVKLMYIEPLNRHIAFLTIAGEGTETLSFGLYNTQTGEEIHDAEEWINFNNNATLGDLRTPYVIHFRGLTGLDEWASNIHVFPNPVARGEMVRLGITGEELGKVQIEIINALGVVETQSVASQQTITAPMVAGVYTLRITVEGKGTCYRKLVVR